MNVSLMFVFSGKFLIRNWSISAFVLNTLTVIQIKCCAFTQELISEWLL